MSEGIKNCPFCGGKAHVNHTAKPISERIYFVDCAHGCEARKYGKTESEAIAAWNTRHERECEWKYDGRINVYDTSCGGCIQWDVGMPEWCPDCGGKVKEARQ